MFYSGQKVVCVWDKEVPGFPETNGEWSDLSEALHKDKVYTVDRIMQDMLDPSITICTLFEVQRCRDAVMCGLLGYGVIRFRPLNERKADISVFKEMLNTIPKQLESV